MKLAIEKIDLDTFALALFEVRRHIYTLDDPMSPNIVFVCDNIYNSTIRRAIAAEYRHVEIQGEEIGLLIAGASALETYAEAFELPESCELSLLVVVACVRFIVQHVARASAQEEVA